MQIAPVRATVKELAAVSRDLSLQLLPVMANNIWMSAGTTQSPRHRRAVRTARCRPGPPPPHQDPARHPYRRPASPGPGRGAGRPREPGPRGRFHRPSLNANNAFFLARGWDMLNLARTHRDLLVQHGLGSDLPERLATSLTLYERVSERAAASRQAHVGERAGLLEAVNLAVKLVGVLDAINRTRFSGDAKTLHAWESAANVNGPSRRSTPPSPTPPLTPGNGTLQGAA